MTPMFSKTLVHDGRIRSYHVSRDQETGWEIREAADQHVLRCHSHQDWHRVERALEQFSVEIEELRRQGWREA